MAYLAPSTLHKVAAVMYGLITPGHLVFGFQAVYPALEQIQTDKPGPRGGKRGARLCWDLVATALLAQALMHWKWSRTGASGCTEEAVTVLALTAHILWNGFQYLRIGEPAGPLLIVAAATGMTALVADIRT